MLDVARPRLRALLALGALAVAARGLCAQAFPIQVYDVAEGLPSPRITCIQQDSRGYLWFGTWEGLSRFDGFEFRNYGAADGLPSALVNSIAETPWGEIWVGTQGGGLAIYDPERKVGSRAPLFRCLTLGKERAANQVNAFLFDAKGRPWIGTQEGLYRAEREDASPSSSTQSGPSQSSPSQSSPSQWRFEAVHLGAPIESPRHAVAGSDGRLWFAFPKDLLEVVGDGVRVHPAPQSPGAGVFEALIADSEGSLLAAREHRLDRFTANADTGDVHWASQDYAPGAASTLFALHRDAAGALWLGSSDGLRRWDGTRLRHWGAREGLPDPSIRFLFEDRARHLWFATLSAGVCRRSPADIANFTPAQGVPERLVTRAVFSQDGRTFATTDGGGIVEIEDDGARLVEGSSDPRFLKFARTLFQDRRGDWWIGCQGGVARIRGKELRLAGAARLGPETGLPESWVCQKIAQDRDGRIVVAVEKGGHFVSDPDPGDLPQFTAIPAAPAAEFGFPREIYVAPSGAVWLLHWQAMGRLRGGAVIGLPNFQGSAILDPRCALEDRAGRLWIGTRMSGVWMTETPSAENPTFARVATEQGLPSLAVFSIAEDGRGDLWFGTSRGLARYDPRTRTCDLLQTNDGLPGDIVYDCKIDARGILWVATSGGLSRIDPLSIAPHGPAPAVIFSSIEADGELVPIPDTGASRVETWFPSSTRRLAIAYTAIAPGGVRELRYQFRLGDGAWSAPSRERSIQFASLPAGDYRFEVRAEGSAESAAPATLRFQVLPPLWQRPWFLALAALGAALGLLAIHRLRVRRLLALERIRRQIATDIHDDLGAGLSQIAILSEVVKRDANPAGRERLDSVADLARGLRDSMGDIVWALDPRRDRASDLVARMRHFTYSLLEAEGRVVEFEGPGENGAATIRLEPDQKRQLFLFFKEALHNVVRHARAARVEVRVALAAGELRLLVKDDGVGFDPAGRHAGHGLGSLAERAERLRAALSIDSASGRGTTISLRVPLRPASHIFMRG